MRLLQVLAVGEVEPGHGADYSTESSTELKLSTGVSEASTPRISTKATLCRQYSLAYLTPSLDSFIHGSIDLGLCYVRAKDNLGGKRDPHAVILPGLSFFLP